MRSRWMASSLLVAALVPQVAFAETELQATLSTSTGFTTNSTGVAGSSSESSAFGTIQPGAELLVASENTVQRLVYSLGLNFFLTGDGASSLSNNLSYSLGHTFSDFTDGLLDLSVAHTQSNTATLGASPTDGTINAQPSGTTQFLSFGGGFGLSHQLSALWRTTEGVSGTYTSPVDSSGFVVGASFNGQASLGLDRELQLGNVGLSLGGGYIFIEGLGAAAMTGVGPVDDQKEILLSPLAHWQRILSPTWTLDLAAGATGAAPAADPGQMHFYPTGSGVLGYQVDRHSAALSYGRGVTLNPFLRQIIEADDVVARGIVPLGRSRYVLTGALGYQHARTISADGADATEPATTLDLFSVDLDVGYEISPTMALGARYQFGYQKSDSTAMAVPDLQRHSVSVVFTARYPDRTKTVVPFRQPLKMLRAPTLGTEPARPARGGR